MATITIPGDANDVSDGYHTIGELYDHRCALWVNLCLAYKDKAFKTRYNDSGLIWPGWFILGLMTDQGQITYHVPEQWWDTVKDIPNVGLNSNYDGHTSADVLARLTKAAKDGAIK